MSEFDVRTRTAADIRSIDSAAFFREELPRLFGQRSHLATKGAAEFDAQSLTITTESGSWTLDRSADGFEISEGSSGDTAITLSEEDFSDLINDLTTFEMLSNLKLLGLEHGNATNAHCWETILRSVVDGIPMFTEGSIIPSRNDGRPLDLDQAFMPDADDEDVAHFLAEAGFVHLSGWLDEGLMREIAEDMDREFAKCIPTDDSWWVTLADGSRRPARILDFADRSDAVRRLMASAPFQRLAQLTDDAYTHSGGVEALQKPIGVVEGTSDIPWHRDCAGGMHSYLCRSLTVGVQVTGAGPGSAQLGVIAGSHRALMPTHRDSPRGGLEPRFLTTSTGDMTVHCSCLLHTALAPTKYERKVLYTPMFLPRDPALVELTRASAERRNKVGAAATAQ
jgi:hypothetical protein